MCRPTSRSPEGAARASRQRGFTLIEALIALAVMAISLAAIGALSASSLRSALYVERHLAQIETTRKIIAGLPSRDALGNGVLTGEAAGQLWRIDTAPYVPSFYDPTAQGAWSAQSVAVQVRAPSGALVQVTEIRLRKRQD